MTNPARRAARLFELRNLRAWLHQNRSDYVTTKREEMLWKEVVRRHWYMRRALANASDEEAGKWKAAAERDLQLLDREVQQRVQLGAVIERQRNAQRLQAKKRSADTRQRVKRLADRHLSGIPRSRQVAVLQSAWPVSRERLSDKQVRNILKDLGFRR